ncbi:MAG: universal stress protein [Thiotrichales bacterium]|nr:universal stress protein [Thiotrichales bacterium]
MTDKTWLFASLHPDQETALFEWAIDCCRQQNIKLTLVTVLPKLGHSVFEWFEMLNHPNILQEQIDYETQRRQKWFDMAENAQVDLNIVVRFGKFFYETIQLAHELNVELLIKQTDDIKHQGNLMFQSVDWHLLRKSPVPLLLYRENTPLPFERIMASLDVDIEAPPYSSSEFNQSLLGWATHFKGSEPIKVVHAWQSEVENLVRHWNTDLTDDELIKLSEQLYLEHKQALSIELTAHGLEPSSAEVFLRKGDPADAVAATVLEQNIDLLVLGTLGRSGVPGLLIGNTAEDLLERVNCSVLAIKPNTFKSPIL